MRKYQVKNGIVYLGWLLGLWYNVRHYGLEGMCVWFLGMVFPILCLWLLFTLKMMGAGDIKVLSMVGGFYGFHEARRILVFSFLIGAILSIIHVIRYKNLFIRLRYLVNYIAGLRSKKRISPYYVRKRDGEDSIIPFTLAIATSVIICTKSFI